MCKVRIEGLKNPEVCPSVELEEKKHVLFWRKDCLMETILSLDSERVYLVLPKVSGAQKRAQTIEVAEVAGLVGNLEIVVIANERSTYKFPPNVTFTQSALLSDSLAVMTACLPADLDAFVLEDIVECKTICTVLKKKPEAMSDWGKIILWKDINP